MRHTRRATIAGLALIALQMDVLTARTALQATAEPLLVPGVEIRGTLDSTGNARYRIALRDGDAVDVQVSQPTVDLRLRLVQPHGEEVVRTNLRRPLQGEERLRALATSDGEHVLVIERAGGARTTAAAFAVTSLRVHPATDDDRTLSAAAQAYAQGDADANTGAGDALRAALASFERARAGWMSVGASLEAATALNRIGGAHMQLANLQDARRAHDEALRLRRAIGDRYGEGVSLNNVAAIHSRLGDYETAATLYEQSVAVRRAVGDREGMGWSLMGLAFTRGRMTEGWASVVRTYQDAFELLEEAGDRRGMGEALYNLGYGYKQLNEFDRATAYFDRALAIRRELNDSSGRASVLTQVAAIHLQLGDPERALEILEEALPLRRQSGDRRGEAYTVQTVGVALTRLEQPALALRRLAEAQQLFDAIGDREGHTSALMHMASVTSFTGVSLWP